MDVNSHLTDITLNQLQGVLSFKNGDGLSFGEFQALAKADFSITDDTQDEYIFNKPSIQTLPTLGDRDLLPDVETNICIVGNSVYRYNKALDVWDKINILPDFLTSAMVLPDYVEQSYVIDSVVVYNGVWYKALTTTDVANGTPDVNATDWQVITLKDMFTVPDGTITPTELYDNNTDRFNDGSMVANYLFDNNVLDQCNTFDLTVQDATGFSYTANGITPDVTNDNSMIYVPDFMNYVSDKTQSFSFLASRVAGTSTERYLFDFRTFTDVYFAIDQTTNTYVLGNENATIFVNGIEVFNGGTAFPIDTLTEITVVFDSLQFNFLKLARKYDSTVSTNKWAGEIAHVEVYDRALTVLNIQSIVSNPTSTDVDRTGEGMTVTAKQTSSKSGIWTVTDSGTGDLYMTATIDPTWFIDNDYTAHTDFRLKEDGAKTGQWITVTFDQPYYVSHVSLIKATTDVDSLWEVWGVLADGTNTSIQLRNSTIWGNVLQPVKVINQKLESITIVVPTFGTFPTTTHDILQLEIATGV